MIIELKKLTTKERQIIMELYGGRQLEAKYLNKATPKDLYKMRKAGLVEYYRQTGHGQNWQAGGWILTAIGEKFGQAMIELAAENINEYKKLISD